MDDPIRDELKKALKAFRRIKAHTSESEDFRPTTEGSIRRIAAEEIVRIETVLKTE